MLKYITQRLLIAMPIALGVCVIVFSLMYFSPYDPAEAMANEYHLSAEQIAMLRQEMKLDEPYFVQLGNWFLNLLQGNLGTSLIQRRPILEMIVARFGTTFELAIAGMTLAATIGIVLGVLAALKENSIWDSVSMAIALLGSAMPDFWLALMFIFLFSLTLGWLPTLGQGTPKHLLMPAVVVGLAEAGVVARTVRSSLIETLNEDYIRTARSKGLKERMVVLRHGLRNALIPTVTILGINLGAVLGGVVIVETVFAREGIGRLLVDSVLATDIPVVQGVVLFSALVFLLVNLIVDISYAFLDPRIRYEANR
jgi:ABC-type dipeptide/oligopeptide/nickel transport system permease component